MTASGAPGTRATWPTGATATRSRWGPAEAASTTTARVARTQFYHCSVVTRRRYKVVAEQYCKISPLICMVCLYF